jgi:uracil-DNA glycosylase
MPKIVFRPVVPMSRALDRTLAEVHRCRLCAAELPLGPRPIVRVAPQTRLLLVGQAPSTTVHASGLPFDGRSGDRLRDWLGIGRDQFYGNARLGFMPVGFCYTGRNERGGDNPPARICAPTWHPRLRPLLPNVEMTLLVGQYALARYLGSRRKASLTETVEAWRDYLPEFLPLPHPSWRNTGWLTRHPWFEREVVTELRRQVKRLLELP